MRDHDQEFICVLAAIMYGASGNVPMAIGNAEAIIRIVKERHPDHNLDPHEHD